MRCAEVSERTGSSSGSRTANQERLTLHTRLDTGKGRGKSTEVKDVSFVENEAPDFTHFSANVSTFTALCFSHHNSLRLREKQETPVTLHVFSTSTVFTVHAVCLSVCLFVCLSGCQMQLPVTVVQRNLFVKTRWGWIEFLMLFLSVCVLPHVYTDTLL